jgi:hypothetical protein
MASDRPDLRSECKTLHIEYIVGMLFPTFRDEISRFAKTLSLVKCEDFIDQSRRAHHIDETVSDTQSIDTFDQHFWYK